MIWWGILVVARNDLQIDAQLLQLLNRLAGVCLWRIGKDQEPDKCHVMFIGLRDVIRIHPSNGESQHSQSVAAHRVKLRID
jgi:hypothetical protein